MDKELFDQLHQSMKEAVAIAKGNHYITLSEAADRLACPVEKLQNLALCGSTNIFAQAITENYEGLHGNEGILAPIFQISTGQLKKILDNNGAVIDPDLAIGDNGFIWVFGVPRKVRVELNDLRVMLSGSGTSINANSSNPVETVECAEKTCIQSDELSELASCEQEQQTELNTAVSEPYNRERPKQLDRKGKIGPLATLIVNALRHYYDATGNYSKTLIVLMSHIKKHWDGKKNTHDFLGVIKTIGSTDKQYLLLKTNKGNKWQKKNNVMRTYAEQKKRLTNSPEEISS